MNRFLSFIFFLTVSCPIIPGENSDESFDPEDNSSSEDILEYNPYSHSVPKKKPSRKRNGSSLSNKKTIKKKIDSNNTDIPSNNNYCSLSPHYFCSIDTSYKGMGLDEYQSNLPFIHRSSQSNNNTSSDTLYFLSSPNNNTPSRDPYHYFYHDVTGSPWNPNNNNDLVKKSLLRENIINHIRTIKPSEESKKNTLEQKNKNDKETIIKNNDHIRKEDLEKCFEMLEKINPHIPISEAIYELQKRYNEKK